MLRRVCQNKAFSHVCHLCQNMEPLEVVVLPLSISLWLILRNEPPSPFIHSAGVLEEKDGAKEDWRTSYSMKRKRKLCHLLKCLSVSLTFISSLCTYYRHLHILKVKLKLNDAYICFENYRPPIFNLKTNPEWFFFLSYHGSPPPHQYNLTVALANRPKKRATSFDWQPTLAYYPLISKHEYILYLLLHLGLLNELPNKHQLREKVHW